eukprot:scaffold427_cov263-Pinguiococcus_pyrenoidosus.AAC.25
MANKRGHSGAWPFVTCAARGADFGRHERCVTAAEGRGGHFSPLGTLRALSYASVGRFCRLFAAHAGCICRGDWLRRRAYHETHRRGTAYHPRVQSIEENVTTDVSVTGFEVDPEALEDAHRQREDMEEAFKDKLRLYGKDAMQAEPDECDWAAVDVCYAYLTKAGLRQVFPQLQERMRPGAAFYCIQFSVDGADAVEEGGFDFVDDKGEDQHFTFYKYAI